MSSLIGTPYTDKDCWDIVKLFYEKYFNVDLSHLDFITSDSQVNAKHINNRQQYFHKIEQPSLGDIILFRVLGHNSHVGVYLEKDKFLHTQAKTGCVIDRIHKWKTRVQGYYRWPSLD